MKKLYFVFVAAGAVVTRNVAAGSIVGGVPAKPLKSSPPSTLKGDGE